MTDEHENSFEKKKDIILLNIHNLGITTEASFSRSLYNDVIDNEFFIIRNSLIAFRCVFLKRIEYIVEKKLTDNEEDRKVLDQMNELFYNGIDTDEDFVHLLATVLEYKYVHMYENVVNEFNKIR
jgi:hypothetical protein